MEIEPNILELFQIPEYDLNEIHLAQYLLMRRISKNGQREFSISSRLLGKHLGATRYMTRKRRKRLVKLGLVQIVRYDRTKLIYRVPVPYEGESNDD